MLSIRSASIGLTHAATQELRKVESVLEKANEELWNQRGLNLLSPRKVALQYVRSSRWVIVKKAYHDLDSWK